MYDIIELNGKLVTELREIAKKLSIPKHEKLLKQDLIYKILDHQAMNPTAETIASEKKEVTKKRRGRPPKSESAKPAEKAPQAEEDAQAPKRRGRKRKDPQPLASSNVGSTQLKDARGQDEAAPAEKGQEQTLIVLSFQPFVHD